ncbi:MAG: hypothetical protein ABIZ56_08245 [Chthoniobacteraceae bacterium]
MKSRLLLSLAVVSLSQYLPASGASIWVEGEAPAKSTMQKHGWYDAVKRDVLSGGGWLSHYGEKAGECSYEVEVAEVGDYSLFARLNPVASEPKWRLDGGAWTAVTTGMAQQQQNIAGDGKLDHRFIAWVKVGKVTLAKGKHEMAFRFEGGASNSGGLDCFVLTTEPFVPQGTMKPGAGASAVAAGPGDWFPLLADDDAFDPRSVIDMSRLVPAPAGQFGFLKAKGDKLQFEKAAAPVKFWGVGANLETGKYSREQLTQRAKYLRKFGCNVVREHPFWDEVTTGGRIDAKKLDAYDWWFAELKKHGIYSAWSVFYHWLIGPEAGYDLFDDLPQERNSPLRDTYGVIASAPKLWELRTPVLVELLAHKNPYTGLRYADDPALATVEMNNEESIFFWNPLGDLAAGDKKWPRHAQRLRESFAAWTKARYQSDDALKAAWGELKNGDSVNARELKLMNPWELDGDGIRGAFAGQTQRAGDAMRFLAEMQRANFAACEQAMRGAGFRGVTITTAWLAGSGLGELPNLWTDTAADMIDRHDYFGGGEGHHSIAEGGVQWQSHLTRPGLGIFSRNLRVVEGRPFCMTEWSQSPPNRWKLEAAPLMAFYALGLQGWDASWHFAQSGTRLGDGWPQMSAYASDTPHYLGQFPALAFALYHGHVKEAPAVLARRFTTDEIFSGRDAAKKPPAPAETFAIGRVTAAFDGGKNERLELEKYWDEKNKIITSATDELVWDYGRERVLLRGSKTQAVLGKPGPDPIALPGVTATIRTPFVSLIFTPLDDAPLAQSKQILITALAQDKQTGARYNADGTRLESTGTAPLLLEPVQATLKFAEAKPASVTPCDPSGVPISGKSVPIAADGSFSIDGTYRAYYYEVKR